MSTIFSQMDRRNKDKHVCVRAHVCVGGGEETSRWVDKANVPSGQHLGSLGEGQTGHSVYMVGGGGGGHGGEW